MVGAYFDSSVLVKTYCPELNSRAALELLDTEGAPLPLTHFQELELRNAFRLKLFRGELQLAGTKMALANLEQDINAGLFIRPMYILQAVFRRAEGLSARHTESTGTRTIDILHVAAALEIGSRKFISFDERQRAVAKKAGLTIAP